MCKICGLATRFQRADQGNVPLLTTADLSTVISQSFTLTSTGVMPQIATEETVENATVIE